MLGLGIGLGACATRGIYHPTPPIGFVFITDADGAYLTDADGAYILEAI